MANVKIGLRIPFSGPVSSSERLRESAVEAEALGFDAVFAQDHIHKAFERHPYTPMASGSLSEPSNTKDPISFETVSSLSFLAGATRRLELATAVMPLPLREPVVLAKQLATADAHSGGRLILGVGVANKTDRDEFRAMGVPFRPYQDRYRLAGEYIGAMRTIWENPTATFHGDFVKFDDLTIYPKPARRIPVWIGCGSLAGGVARPSVRFAIDHADGVIPPAITSPDEIAAMVDDFAATAGERGRDLTGFAWCAQRRISIGSTVPEAESNVDWMKREQAEMWRYVGHMRDRGPEGTQISHEMATVGTPDQIAANLQRYVAAGVNWFAIAFTYPTYEVLLRQMRLFAKEVLPAIKRS
jgi:probable F420-dependent oxidoreductase